MKVLLLCIALFCASVIAERTANCYLRTTSNAGSAITGVVTFTQADEGGLVTVRADISGLGTADYAMHVHQYGDLTNNTGASAGPHFVGAGSASHACPPSARHEGDMGSWTASAGVIAQEKQLDLLTLSGTNSIIGRAVVLHAQTDSCDGDSGNAGSRIAFCVIGINNSTTNTASQSFEPNNLVCSLQGTTNCPSCSGTVYFQNQGTSVLVTAYVDGLQLNSVHGFHIHTYGSLFAADGTSLGPHWNPFGATHDLYNSDHSSSSKHQGDMGNIQSYQSSNGRAWYKLDNKLLETTLSSLAGRGVVVHSVQDHGRGFGCDNSTGNAGVRLAVCVIGVAADTLSVPSVPSSVNINNNFQEEDCEARPSSFSPSSGSSSSGSSSSGSSFSSSSGSSSSGSSGSSGSSSSNGAVSNWPSVGALALAMVAAIFAMF